MPNKITSKYAGVWDWFVFNYGFVTTLKSLKMLFKCKYPVKTMIHISSDLRNSTQLGNNEQCDTRNPKYEFNY